MRTTSLSAYGAIAIAVATAFGCQGPASAPAGRVTLTSADPAHGIAGEYVSTQHTTFRFRAGSDAGSLGVAELRDENGVVVASLANRGDGELALVLGGQDLSGVLHGDQAAHDALAAFSHTQGAKTFSQFSTALEEATQGAPELAVYVDAYKAITDLIETAPSNRPDDSVGYAACDQCSTHCSFCYMLPDFLGGICLGAGCGSS